MIKVNATNFQLQQINGSLVSSYGLQLLPMYPGVLGWWVGGLVGWWVVGLLGCWEDGRIG
ncbi:MAG: hypothetical protein H6606_05215 [Flavobacteriales bacterium]|nr:hypothetical protein [Flavobacteriales bacterium]